MNKTKLGILEDMLIKKEKIKSEDSSLRVENTAEGLQASISCIESNKLEQETREGYNLVDETSISALTNIEKIENEIATTVLINNESINNLSFIINKIKIEKGDYYLSCDIRLKSGSCQKINSLQMTGNINQDSLLSTEVISFPNISNEFQRYIRKYTFKDSVAENEEVLRFLIQALKCEDAIFEIKNIQISRENKDYEKFGAKPSRNFESKVEGVTGDLKLKVQNKNLAYDIIYSNPKVQYYPFARLKYKLTEGRYYIISYDTENNGFFSYINSGSYYGLRKITDLYSQEHDGSKKKWIVQAIKSNLYEVNLINRLDATSEIGAGCIYNLMIEEIDATTDKEALNYLPSKYVEHKEQEFTISLGDKTLYKGDKIVYLNKNNPNATEGAGWYEYNKMIKYIFDGTETWKLTNTQPTSEEWTSFYPVTAIKDKYNGGVRNEDICFSNYYKDTNNESASNIKIINDAISNIILTNPTTSGQIMIVSQNSTVEEMKDECKRLYDEGNPLYFVYTLQEPTYKPVTDEKLIKQLDAILLYMTEYEELTNFDFDNDVIFEITVEKDNLKIINSRLDELEKQNTNTQALSLEMEA